MWLLTPKEAIETTMAVLGSIVKKETWHIVRDRRTSLITIVMPLVLLLLFGFAISTEVNNVRIVTVVENHTDRTRQLIQQLQVNEYFDYKGSIAAQELEQALQRGSVDAVVLLRDIDGKLTLQIIVDASNPTIARSTEAYITGALGDRQDAYISTRTLYNPQLESAYNFVPGIMGMIFILVCAIMTSVSIVGEKESGTMNLLLVSPARPSTIIFGKLIPYFLLSCIILVVMLVISYGVLGLPLSQSVGSVVVLTLLYIVLSLAIGLLVSTLVNNQVAALIVSAIIFMVPVIFLSGMIFPIDNMPTVLQWISCIIPARWYIEALRKLMVQQLELKLVFDEIIILLAMTALILGVAIGKFRSIR